MSKKTIVAINTQTGSKYVKCEIKGKYAKVATKGSSSTWLVDKKFVKLV